ncbi:hypothetical protein BDW62DRAFT_186663, partial [Aspergillus aurantiobrunneus]
MPITRPTKQTRRGWSATQQLQTDAIHYSPRLLITATTVRLGPGIGQARCFRYRIKVLAQMATKPASGANAAAQTPSTATSELQSSLRELHIGEKTSSITDIARPKLTTSVNTAIPAKKKKVPVVADSWEDEINDSSSPSSDRDTEAVGELDLGPTSSNNVTEPNSLGTSPAVAEGPLDPPPTPISPQTSQPWVAAASGGYGPTSGSAASRSRSTSASTSATAPARDPGRRPEKQTAVAGRLIAGALGIRAPKRTEEQRAYDRAVKEREIRRRNKEKEDAARLKEQEEKAKAAIWD